VYQRADLTRIYMSQALGPYCPLDQDVTSWNYTEGAAVHLNMEEYERERKHIDILSRFLINAFISF